MSQSFWLPEMPLKNKSELDRWGEEEEEASREQQRERNAHWLVMRTNYGGAID
jgi:hypothetical protein